MRGDECIPSLRDRMDEFVNMGRSSGRSFRVHFSINGRGSKRGAEEKKRLGFLNLPTTQKKQLRKRGRTSTKCREKREKICKYGGRNKTEFNNRANESQ